MSTKKICVFLGTRRGFEVLKTLLEKKYNVSSVVILNQNSHEYENYTSNIKKLCKVYKIPFETSTTLKPQQYADYLRKVEADLVFMISWRFIVPTECFGIPNNGIFVVHDSLLPKYRGYSPTNWVIINGEKKTGLSLQKISEEMDSGDLVLQYKIKIKPSDTAFDLNNTFLRLYPKIVLEGIKVIGSAKFKATKQNEKLATYGCKRIPEDGKIDFLRMRTKEIVKLIKGLTYPYPGAFAYYGDKKIIIWEAEELKNPPNFAGRIPGTLISKSENGFKVLTLDGVLKVTKASESLSRLSIKLK